MQDLDNNMDELFRKAAEGYSLKTGMGDWDKLAPMILGSPAINVADKKRKIKKYSSLLLLLFTFLFIIGITTKYKWTADESKANLLQKKMTDETVAVIVKNQENTTFNVNPLKKIKYPGGGDKSALHPQQFKKRSASVPVKNTVIIKQEDAVLVENDTGEGERLSNKPEKRITFTENESGARKSFAINKITHDNFLDSLNKNIIVMKDISLGKNINQPNTGNISNEAPKLEAINKKQKKIYIGLVFGPSFNQVKNQGLQKPGYDVGLLAGYQLNKKLSVETGLLFEQKYYYSTGQYFNMVKLGSSMPAGMKVISLKGSFAVFEIPLIVKYNLYKKTDRHFYITAGVSTYLLTKEYNQYQTITDGTQRNLTGTYNNMSLHSAASLNLSIGFEKNIRKAARIRLEPYLQIPLKGIGVGSMPVTTAGVHIGFFRLAH